MNITVNELIEKLKLFQGDKNVHFGGLNFYRIKDRGSEVQIEFDENVYVDMNGKIIVDDHKGC